MATQEKLLKSLELLRTLSNSNLTPETPSRRKDKIHHCNVVTEAMSNATIRVAPNFPHLLSFSIEVFLRLCDDVDSDVRMMADECLNRLIRAMSDSNVSKVQIELHKEIKKNGTPGSLRAALFRFAQLAHHIRPHKGKPYVANLLPCIVKISERSEEMVHEALANSLGKILGSLGCFTTDNDIKMLLKAFLNNISTTTSAVVRRNSINCILTTCLNCRKSYVFITYVLNNLLDMLIPMQEGTPSSLILGVMGCLKVILPHVNNSDGEHEIKDSFGARKEVNETPFSVDRLLQIYELCLHYVSDDDHNVVNASLETLNTLLQNLPDELESILLSQNGLSKSRIMFYESSAKLKQRSPSQLSVATTSLSGEDSLENDLLDSIRPDIEKWIDESKLSVSNVTYARTSVPLTTKVEIDRVIDHAPTTVNNDSTEYSNIAIGVITGDFGLYDDRDDKLLLDRPTDPHSNTSSEHSFTQYTTATGGGDRSQITSSDVLYKDVCVGDFRDKDVALLYCARLITKSFLLTGHLGGTVPDRSVRVSVKSLSLACLATIFQIYPEMFLRYLDKSHHVKTDRQQMSDVLAFKDHSDPQLRGTVRMLVGNFLRSVLTKSAGDYDGWIGRNSGVKDTSVFRIENFVKIIVNGLEDESSNCSKQSLQCLNVCLKPLLESPYSLRCVPILDVLPILAKNPYWLVKVTLLEVVSDLQYVTLQYVTENSKFQDKVLFNILFELLKDDNQKVRTACATAFVKIVPRLHFREYIPNETLVTSKAKCYDRLLTGGFFQSNLEINPGKKQFVKNRTHPFDCVGSSFDERISQSLSRIISKLNKFLITSTSKYFVDGCIETLCLLSFNYPPTVYHDAWSCFTTSKVFKDISSSSSNLKSVKKEAFLSSSAGLFAACVNLLTGAGTVAYDLQCHLNMLNLAGNLFAGLAIQNLKPKTDISLEDDSGRPWNMFTDPLLSNLTEQCFVHVLKLLNVFCHVLDELVPVQPPQNKPSHIIPNLGGTQNPLSPIKRRKSDMSVDKIRSLTSPSGKLGTDKEKDEKGINDKKGGGNSAEISRTNLIGFFASSPHYLKLYDVLKTSYSNYKTTLDAETSGKFLNLLRTILQSLSKFLELATLLESGRASEEMLNYFRFTFNCEPSATVECVQQLLRSLFGTNLILCNVLDQTKRDESLEANENDDLFYCSIFEKNYKNVVDCLNDFQHSNKIERDGDALLMGYKHRREAKSVILPKGADKILASYIRLFEPMVIKSLKQYTITSDVQLQCQVLQLLCQLVHLRVNYCLLDSEQIFIGFVLKQFEYLEEGQIPFSSNLIPWIFNFLVQLSYSKQHSKSIIGIPKILQLCDGLMASGQPPLTHCIPALEPVVKDIFLYRNKSNTSDFKELETTREVFLAILLRLLEYPQVISLLTLILNESKFCNDNLDKWPKWSKQVCDAFLPVLKQNKFAIERRSDLCVIKDLVFALNPSVFKPLNTILVVLFDEVPQRSQIDRWLAKILTGLLVVSRTKEELLLVKIEETKFDFAPQSVFKNVTVTSDPLNVTSTSGFLDDISPDAIFVRFLFRVIDVALDVCVRTIEKSDDVPLTIELLSSLLFFCLYIFQSGNHRKITNTAVLLVDSKNVKRTSDGLNESVAIDNINDSIIKLAVFYPTVAFQWVYLLTLLNYCNESFWKRILARQNKSEILKNPCINSEIVRVGSTIIFSDYLAENFSNEEFLRWFLTENIETLVSLCDEDPVNEFFSTLHRSSSTSALVIQSISARCLPMAEPTFKRKILKCVENSHSSQVGNLLSSLLVPRLLDDRHLALSRLAANLTSRKIELLLTMSKEEVEHQLSKESLVEMVCSLGKLRPSGKYETLVGLLNKLAIQSYGLNSPDSDKRQLVDANYIKNLHVNSAWYFSQVRSKCCDLSPVVGQEIAELLSRLSYEDLIKLMSDEAFNKSILKECILWAKNKTEKNDAFLIKASHEILIKYVRQVLALVPEQHQLYLACGREQATEENVYSERLGQIFHSGLNWSLIYDVIPSLTAFIELLPYYPSANFAIASQHEDLAKFFVLCLESVNFLVEKSDLNLAYVDAALSCTRAIAQMGCRQFFAIFDRKNQPTRLCSAINSVYKLVSHLLLGNEPLPDVPKFGLKATLDNPNTTVYGHACYQLSVLVCWMEKRLQNVSVPKFLLDSLDPVIVSMARLPLVNSYLLTPPSAWKNGLNVELSGPFKTEISTLPIELLQEIEVLEEFIYRLTLLGWTCRQQFEESWMCLLSVLNASLSEESTVEETNAIMHSISLAVQGITSLLLQTLYLPTPGIGNINSELLHVSRDFPINLDSKSIQKLKSVQDKLLYRFNEYASVTKLGEGLYRPINVFSKPNLDKISAGYSFEQLSVEFLLISIKTAEMLDEKLCTSTKIYESRQKLLVESGLDLNSCLQFLIDLYTQWITAQNTPLRLFYEVVKSILVISDLFTEKSQFNWMLDLFLELTKSHTIEDEILQQYLVVGVTKAVAVLSPDLETYETVKKLLIQNLKSGFLPSKIASLHGILYILQGSILSNTHIGGLSEEMQLIFNIAIDYLQAHINSNAGVLNQSIEHTLLFWSIAFYLIENVDESNFPSNFHQNIIQAAVTCVSQQKVSTLSDAVLKGLERLIIKRKIVDKNSDHLYKLCLEKMRQGHPTTSFTSIQTLLTCIYTASSKQLDETGSSETTDASEQGRQNPDDLVQTIEKISDIFDHIKKGYPFEVEILCSVLPDILDDFFPPADILTKVIGEFLSPQQPHPRLLSRVVFGVFQRAIARSQLSLLQDWVVFSLANFTQSSVGMSIWCLNCFFISASTNEWLRSSFPYVQSRMGRCDYEDKTMLCIAGADFYRNLSGDRQRRTFVESFNRVEDRSDSPFRDLLASL